MRTSRLFLLAAVAVLLAGCAAGDARFADEAPAGFWWGLWHGVIAPIAFVVGLFDDGVQIYERANTGAWYDLGFLLGILCVYGGGHRSQRRLRDRSASASPPGRGKARVTIDVDWKGSDGDDAPRGLGTLGEPPKPTA
jgi:hypothetical protein